MTFTIPLTNAQLPAMSAGELEINYSQNVDSVYWRSDYNSKWILIPLMMLRSEMFAGLMIEIEAAVENNKINNIPVRKLTALEGDAVEFND